MCSQETVRRQIRRFGDCTVDTVVAEIIWKHSAFSFLTSLQRRLWGINTEERSQYLFRVAACSLKTKSIIGYGSDRVRYQRS